MEKLQAGDNLAQILLCVAEATRDFGYPPTIREISKITGVKQNRVQRAVEQLTALGFLNRVPVMARTIRLTETGRATLSFLDSRR